MIYIQLSIIALPSYSSMNHFLCFRSILGISKTVNSQILTNIALPLHWDLAHLTLNMLIFGGLHYYSESFIFIYIWSDFLSNILLWIICNMATKTNLKHAGDDFKQWSKYQTNLSQWYLQWKKVHHSRRHVTHMHIPFWFSFIYPETPIVALCWSHDLDKTKS